MSRSSGFRATITGFVLCFASACASAGVVLNIDSGTQKLMGASGVMVDGKSYSVEFVEGSCLSLFSGCYRPSDFVFNTSAGAIAASQALLDSVFIDVAGGGQFDSNASLTYGCSSGVPQCAVWTPYASVNSNQVLYANARNVASNVGSDGVAKSGTSKAADTWSLAGVTYAVWTPSNTAVPEPSSLALLGAAGVALGWSQRRRREVKVAQ